MKIETNRGTLVVELFENEAPETVGNFVSLVEKGFYNGLTFHRVLPGFMAQGGDPNGDGNGGPGYKIYCECAKPVHREHFRGTLSMAKQPQKDTGGSQFFITFRPTPQLDGKHTAFGRVVEGLDVLAKIQRRNPESEEERKLTPDRIVKAEVVGSATTNISRAKWSRSLLSEVTSRCQYHSEEGAWVFEYRVTKYDPAFRDADGAYTRDEWTSVSEIGKSFGGVVLTRDEYERVERAYVEAAMAFLREAEVLSLTIAGLENYAGHPLAFSEGSLLSLEHIAEVIPQVLREAFWCRLEGPEMFLHFGWDYYLYIGVPRQCPQAEYLAQQLVGQRQVDVGF